MGSRFKPALGKNRKIARKTLGIVVLAANSGGRCEAATQANDIPFGLKCAECFIVTVEGRSVEC